MRKLISIICLCAGCAFTNTASVLNKDDAAIAHVRLAVEYLKNGQTARAKRDLLLAEQFSPKLAAVHTGLALYYHSVDEPQNALKAYKKALALEPNGANHNNYGAYLCKTGEHAKGMEHLLLALKDAHFTDEANAYENAAVCSLLQNNTEKADYYFQKAKQYHQK